MAAVQNTAESGTDSRLTLRSRLGVITLVLLCAVQFLDIVDAAIVNVALPSIQHSLGFSQQNLQWVASGYILTYGGFLLLGGRLGDLLGRRRMLLIGLTVFALTSLAAGLANSGWLLIGSRLVQGIGAALMAPAALSKLTTSFREGKDRNTALGAWERSVESPLRQAFFWRSDLPGPGLAVGVLRQPPDLPSRGRRCARVAGPRSRRQTLRRRLRPARGRPGHRGHTVFWSTLWSGHQSLAGHRSRPS